MTDKDFGSNRQGDLPTEGQQTAVLASDDWTLPREITVTITVAGSEARNQEDTLTALLMALHLQDKITAWSDFDEMPRPLYEWMAERELLSHDDMDWNEVIEALDNHENELIGTDGPGTTGGGNLSEVL